MTAMDVSDGLADDLSKLCAASGVAARIQSQDVPVHPMLRQVFPDHCLELALGGGEDYVLLFTGPAPVIEPIIPSLGEGSAVIGSIESVEDPSHSGQVVLVSDSGDEVPLTGRGWDHFQAARAV